MTHQNDSGTIAKFLEEHPRMMGALFAMALLMLETGNVAANATTTTVGP